MELHHAARYQEAAAKFIASYALGFNREIAAYNAACALARAGLTDAAFDWLARAQAAGFDLDEYLDEDEDLRSLRGDRRFAALRGHATRHASSCDDDNEEAEAPEPPEPPEPPELADLPEPPEPPEPPDFDDNDNDARALYDDGRYDEAARAWMEEARQGGNPGVSLYNAACARSLNGDKREALSLLQRAVEAGYTDVRHMDRDDDLDNIRNEPRFRQIRAMAERANDDDDDGDDDDGDDGDTGDIGIFRDSSDDRDGNQAGQAWFAQGVAAIVRGRPDDAIHPFEKAIELDYRRTSSMYNLACAHALAGNHDQAFEWLDKAFASGFDQVWLIKADSDLDALRQDPRFPRLRDLERRRRGR